jgi:hypothetical protein
MGDPALVAAARYERDRRGEAYPRKIAAREIDAEAAAVDFQCWVAIAEWLTSGHFYSFSGGIDPDREGAPIVRWPELEAAAKAALHQVERKLAGEGWLDGMPETETSRRRCALVHIHHKIALRRESIDTINAQIRAPQGEELECH